MSVPPLYPMWQLHLMQRGTHFEKAWHESFNFCVCYDTHTCHPRPTLCGCVSWPQTALVLIWHTGTQTVMYMGHPLTQAHTNFMLVVSDTPHPQPPIFLYWSPLVPLRCSLGDMCLLCSLKTSIPYRNLAQGSLPRGTKAHENIVYHSRYIFKHCYIWWKYYQ